MHELSVAMELVDLACQLAHEQPRACRVVALKLRLGELSGVVEEAVRFGFEIAAAGTAAEGAALEIERVPVSVFCPACRLSAPLESVQRFRCPRCDRPTGRVTEGRDLMLSSVEVEDV
jgi:hydrogenase nickel incorporation protein HypA/HybF